METATLPPFQAFSVLEACNVGQIQIFASLRDPQSGELKTQEFFEYAADGRTMRPNKPAAWEHNLAAGLQPEGSAAGNFNDYYDIFWETWMEGATLQALALTQEDPIAVPMQAGDIRIQPSVLGVDKKLRVFFWRKQGAGYSLFRHIFSGELNQKGAVVTEKILDIPHAPLFSIADPISIFMVRKKGFEERGLAVIGWLSAEGGDMRAHAVWIKGADAKVYDSDPIAGYKPHPRQRIGLYGDPNGSLRLAWLMGRSDTGTYRMAEWGVELAQGMKSLRIYENAFSGAKIHSSASVFLRNSEFKDARGFLLTETGNLYSQSAKEKPKQLRTGVPLTYDFPIFASGYQVYDARIKPDGTLYFDSPY